MATARRRYGKEVFAERGDAIYVSAIRPHLTPADEGKFVAIDIESGEHEIAADELVACDRLRDRVPEAQIGWCGSAPAMSIALAERAGEQPHDYRSGFLRMMHGHSRLASGANNGNPSFPYND